MAYLENLLTLSLEAAPWLVLGLLVGGIIKVVIPVSFLHRHLGGHGVRPVIKAALFGAPLPLCSCGVIPAALGLRRAGASKSSTVSFLVSTPETGVDSVAITYALMGPFMAISRPIAAIVSAITAGLLVGKAEASNQNSQMQEADQTTQSACCGAEKAQVDISPPETSHACCSGEKDKQIAPEPIASKSCCSSDAPTEPVHIELEEKSTCCGSEPKPRTEPASCCGEEASGPDANAQNTTLLSRLWQGIHYAFTDLFSNLIFWLCIGLLFAAAVKTWVPASFLTEWGSGLPAMLLMMVIGIPMYVCASASTPIAAGFMLAGISPGTALVFLMAGPATNISTLGVINKELGKRPLIAYLTGVGVIALLAGLSLDAIIQLWNVDIQSQLQHGHDMLPHWLTGASLLLLVILGIWHALKGRVSAFA